MSGIGGTGGITSGIPGTNVPPISFPGIVSGIDYNSIIQKLTSLTLAPITQIDQQIATLNAANAELLKINGMLASVQNALTALSDPQTYNTYDALSSDLAAATAQGIANVTATPGTYVIDSTTLATSTQIASNTAAGHTELDTIGGVTAANVPLVDSYAAITPTNGSTGTGHITVDGVSVSYDVTTQSLTTILGDINAAVHSAGDSTFNIGLIAGTDQVQITDSAHPVSLGSPGDTGNLLQVLRLDQAQVSSTSSAGTVTATAGVGGINAALSFNSVNAASQTTDANFVTPVTAGTFTINGVQINVSLSQNLYDVINSINQSAAGVVASYNSATGSITLTNKTGGPQNIVLGSSTDTSNFLQAAGLTSSSGAVTTLGTQASVTYQSPSGSPTTVYSNSNTVTDAIPGVQINLLSATTTPYTITVSQDSSQIVSAVTAFASAYNAVISEINQATAPPVVIQSAAGSGGPGSSQSVGGGVLFGNGDVEAIKEQLVSLASALNSENGTTYNSLSSIGLNLTSSYQELSATGTTGSTNPVSLQTVDGTDGTFQPLNVSQLQAAMAADPSAVQNLFNNSQGVVTEMGTYLTGVTGVSTITASALLGTPPSISLLQGFESAIQAQVQNLQTQATQIQDNANQQADQLRAEFVASETAISGYQALQQQLGSFFNGGTSSGG